MTVCLDVVQARHNQLPAPQDLSPTTSATAIFPGGIFGPSSRHANDVRLSPTNACFNPLLFHNDFAAPTPAEANCVGRRRRYGGWLTIGIRCIDTLSTVCNNLGHWAALHNASYEGSASYTAMEVSHIEAGYALLAAIAQATSGDRDKIMVALPVPGDASVTEREPVDSNGARRLPTVDPSGSRLPSRITLQVLAATHRLPDLACGN
mmetsp:Transcript_15647/g.30887  ORF Transcript_15647/g.30887 Transcript_15647/m.30887 type:complete len:207 (+) Transcript_15647:281-901(+)